MLFRNKLFTLFLGRTNNGKDDFTHRYGNFVILKETHVNGCDYRLIKIVSKGGYFTSFHIQFLDPFQNNGYWTFARTFRDNDTEYAENCAREAFGYLTANI